MTGTRRTVWLGVAVGVTAAVATAPLAGLSTAGQYALATMAFAATLWLTEALPLPVTALTVPALLTLFGVYPSMAPALAGFAHPVVFLLLGGFVLAAALRKHGVDRRIAYRILGRVGASPERLVLALMVTTAGLSMAISNTATVALMAPIALGVAGEVRAVDEAATDGTRTPDQASPSEDADGPASAAPADGAGGLAPVDVPSSAPGAGAGATNLELAALLGTAYAASIGGVGTLVGTPPNAIVVAQLERTLGYRITFLQWLGVGLPVVVLTLPVAWYVLAYLVYPPQVEDVSAARERARRRLDATGPLLPAGRRAVYVFAATAALWVLGGLGFLLEGWLPPAAHTTLFGGSGATLLGTEGHQGALYYVLVALAAVPALFLADAVEWTDVTHVDWGTLLLLGGGLSLADALVATDATAWLGNATLGALVGAPLPVVVLAVTALVVAVGELASNTAMAAVLAPLLVDFGARYAPTLGTTSRTAAVSLAVAGAVAASFGFALPVATPPNAIVFGTGRMTKDQMLRAGLPMDAVMVLLLTVLSTAFVALLFPWLFG